MGISSVCGTVRALLDELRRCVNELGFKAGHLVPYTRTQTIDQQDFYPYYEAAEELDMPLLCHPSSGSPMQNSLSQRLGHL